MNRRGNRREGMTLMELVVALSITGVALTAGYRAFGTLVDRRELAARHAAEALRQSVARESLHRWLVSARLTIEEDEIQFRAIDGTARDRQPDDDITFYTTALTPVSAEGTIVRLFVDRDSATPARGLIADLRDWKGARRELLELVPNAAGLDGKFLSGVFGARQWLESWVSTSVLPTAARITLAPAMGDSLPALWRLPVTASLEGGR